LTPSGTAKLIYNYFNALPTEACAQGGWSDMG